MNTSTITTSKKTANKKTANKKTANKKTVKASAKAGAAKKTAKTPAKTPVKTKAKTPSVKPVPTAPVSSTTTAAPATVPAQVQPQAKTQAAPAVQSPAPTALTERWKDDFEVLFRQGQEEYEKFKAEVQDQEDNSRWLPGLPSKGVRTHPIEAPMFAAADAAEKGLDPEQAEYTASPVGSKLYLDLPNNTIRLLDKCGLDSLLGRACIFGSALGRMSVSDMSGVVNTALTVAQGSALVLERYGKVAAIHSDADGGYCPMPIPTLLNSVTREVTRKCGKMEFIGGTNSHSYTSAIWALPDVAEKLAVKYREALLSCGLPVHYDLSRMVPGVRFSTSDTATSSATLRPIFLGKRGRYVQFTGDISVKHTRRSNTHNLDGVALFEQRVKEEVFTRLNDVVDQAIALMGVEIQNPQNVIVGVCNKLRLPKKYGNQAIETMERLTINSPVITAHDLYLALVEAICDTGAGDQPNYGAFELGERVSILTNPEFDWAAVDVGGTVAWAN